MAPFFVDMEDLFECLKKTQRKVHHQKATFVAATLPPKKGKKNPGQEELTLVIGQARFPTTLCHGCQGLCLLVETVEQCSWSNVSSMYIDTSS